MKYDLSDRSHDQVTPARPGGLIGRALMNLSGIPADFAYEHGTRQEQSDLKALGTILFGSSVLSSITVTAGLHLAMGDGEFHPLYALAGLFVGGLTGAIDYVVQYKGTLSSRGLSENRRAGLKLPDSESTSRIPYLVRLVRVGQAATFGFLGGTFLIIGTNFSDVHSYIDNKFMNSNRAVAEEAAKLADAGIARTKEALSVQDAEVNNLSRSIQAVRSNDVRRAIGRKTNAPPTTSNPQLEALERRLAEATIRRDGLAATVSNQEQGRSALVEKVINDSPNTIRKRTGLAAQLEALSALTNENPKLLLFLLALEFLSLALELGPMWAAASRLPSALAARLTLDHFLAVSALAKEGAERLGARRVDQTEPAEPADTAPANDNTHPDMFDGSPITANDNEPANAGMNGAMPRGPGRPLGSKNRPKPLNNGAAHE